MKLSPGIRFFRAVAAAIIIDPATLLSEFGCVADAAGMNDDDYYYYSDSRHDKFSADHRGLPLFGHDDVSVPFH